MLQLIIHCYIHCSFIIICQYSCEKFQRVTQTFYYHTFEHTSNIYLEVKHLLDHVKMPGYNFAYKNREQKSGGGVGAYVKEELDFKNTGRFDQT